MTVHRKAVGGVFLVLLGMGHAPNADGGSSPVASISQKCDAKEETYVWSPTRHGISVTLFVTNTSECDMNMYAWCEWEPNQPPRECQALNGKDAIHPGQTRSFTMKGFHYLTIRCVETANSPPCTGTFQMWR